MVNAYLKGIWPPFRKRSPLVFTAFDNLIYAHNVSRNIIKSITPDTQVGVAEAIRGFDPKNPLDWVEARLRERLTNTLFFRKTDNDFYGVNYFGGYDLKVWSKLTGRGRVFHDRKFSSDQEVFHTASHLGVTLHRFTGSLPPKPIIITENGINDPNDKFRPLFLLSCLMEVSQAIRDGLPIKGYLPWALTDTSEFLEPLGDGRFGLVGVDFDTLERIPRGSYSMYQEICTNGGGNIADLTNRYLTPEQALLIP